MARLKPIIEIILLVDLGECARDLGYFFLIDTDGLRPGHVNEARSAEGKELLISTVSTVYFILGILRTDLWSQGTKKKNLTWSPQKRSRPALT